MNSSITIASELSSELSQKQPPLKTPPFRSVRTKSPMYPANIDTPFSMVIDIPAAALALTKLSELLDRRMVAEYWSEGMALLSKHLSPRSISLSLLEQIPVSGRYGMRVGEFDPSIVDYLNAWEKTLTLAWKHSSQNSFFEVQELQEFAGKYQILHVYIIVDKVVRGALSMVFEVNPALTATQYEAIANLARSFASSALRTTYLDTMQHRLETAYTLYAVLQMLNSSLDLRTVFDKAIDTATTVLDAEAATIFRADVANNRLVFMVTNEEVAGVLEERSIPLDRGVVGSVFKHGQPKIIHDARASDWFDPSFDSQTGFKTRNILCVPLRFQGQTIGVLEVLNKKNNQPFTEQDANWLSLIGDQVAVAMHNAELYQSLRREQERIIKAQEDVRHHLARELHDNTAQMLSLIALRIDMSRALLQKGSIPQVMSELEGIEQVARQANREVRTLLYELRPIILESQGLIPALETYHRQLTNSMPCKIHLNTQILDVDMNLKDASGIFSIIQEAVNNVRKYAHAQNIWIRVYTKNDNLWFEVEDDGVGFDAKEKLATYTQSGSYGLLNMHERASMVNAELTILSPRTNAEAGALVRGVIPLAVLKRKQSFAVHTVSLPPAM